MASRDAKEDGRNERKRHSDEFQDAPVGDGYVRLMVRWREERSGLELEKDGYERTRFVCLSVCLSVEHGGRPLCVAITAELDPSWALTPGSKAPDLLCTAAGKFKI